MESHKKLITERKNAVDALHEQHIAYKDKCDELERAENENRALQAEITRVQAENTTFED
jgi:hypothetical protein